MSDLETRLKQIRALKNIAGIKHLLDKAYEILNNPLFMFNTEYNMLAHTDTSTDDPVWNECVALGTFSYESQKLFAEEGFVDLVASAKTTTFMYSDKLKYDRILGKLFNKDHVHVANLVMVASDKPFEEGDPEVFEAFCQVLSKELVKNEFYQTYGVEYQETYIRRLIEGSIDDKELFAAHIQIIYDGLKPSLYLAVVDIGKCEGGYTKLAYFRDIFRKIYPEFKFSIYSNYIIIIINLENPILNLKTDLKKFHKIFEQNDIYAGISRQFENLYNSRQHFLEAVGALNDGLDRNDGKRIFLFSEN